MTDEEILVEAARRIQLPGMWWQDGPDVEEMDEEAGCIFTTVQKVAGHLSTWNIEKAVLQELGIVPDPRAPFSLEPIFRWNDTPGRTVEEVVTVLLNSKRWL